MRLSAEEYHIFRRQAQENIISHIPKRLDRSKLGTFLVYFRSQGPFLGGEEAVH